MKKAIACISSIIALHSPNCLAENDIDTQRIIDLQRNAWSNSCENIINSWELQNQKERFCKKIIDTYIDIISSESVSKKEWGPLLSWIFFTYFKKDSTVMSLELWEYMQNKYSWEKPFYMIDSFLEEFWVLIDGLDVYRVESTYKDGQKFIDSYDPDNEIEVYVLDKIFFWSVWKEELLGTSIGNSIYITKEHINKSDNNNNRIESTLLNEYGHCVLRDTYKFEEYWDNRIIKLKNLLPGFGNIESIDVHEFISDSYSLSHGRVDFSRIISVLYDVILSINSESDEIVFEKDVDWGYYYSTLFFYNQLTVIYNSKNRSFMKELETLMFKEKVSEEELQQRILKDLSDNEIKTIQEAYIDLREEIFSILSK